MAMVNKKIVHTVFEEVAERYPQRTAVQASGRGISYAELNGLSDEVARLLKQAGVGRDVIVGIALAGGIEYVAAVIGVMKAGGLFLPLDTSLPDQRLAHMLQTSGPKVLILAQGQAAERERLEAVGPAPGAIIWMTPDQQAILVGETAANGGDFQKCELTLPDPDDGCYIIYTSGSTGTPKAIEGCYKSLSHFVHWEVKEFGLDETVRVTQLPPVTFDASLRDIFVPLITGGTLCVPDPEIRTRPKALIDWMAETGVTLIHCVPSLFRMITRELSGMEGAEHRLPALTHILMAGEPLYGKDVLHWMDVMGERTALVNLYGPSETTLVKSFHPIRQRPQSPNAMIPVGQPIANTAILIIKGRRLCEPGEIGDIYIKTPFRTKGYYGDPALTQKSFVANPITGDPQDILYKTGDLGRYLPDRSIEFIGRLDDQVKVNGIRIELGEIEAALRADGDIDQAVVMGRRSPENETVLVGYYTEKKATDAGRIRDGLLQSLPAYMVPSLYVRLDAMPLSINGKVDRKALPEPEELIYEEIAYEPPADETEAALEKIWSEVLHLQKVGVNSPFFQIGGHSLSATRVLAMIYRDLGAEISLKEFFARPTIRALAPLLRRSASMGYDPIPPLAWQADYALSSFQRRLWMLDRMETGTAAYNLPGLFTFEGPCDPALLRRAFNDLVARHESLRTTIAVIGGRPRQRVHAPEGMAEAFWVEELDLRHLAEPERRAVQYAREQAELPFDLENGPLLRVTVIALAEEKQAVFFNLHHIIGDAWSLEIMAREVWALYEAYSTGKEASLAPLTIQYRDFAAWHNARIASEEMQRSADYWQQKLSGVGETALDLPLDFPRPRLRTYPGKYYYARLEKGEMERLAAVAHKGEVSRFMLLLALVKTLLHRYTGQEDIIIGAPAACRNHPDLQEQIGFYANTLALRDRVRGGDTFAGLLSRVKQTVVEAFEHQYYPFDRLVEELPLQRDPGRAPLFEVMLVLHEEEDVAGQGRPPGLTALTVDAGTSRFDLTFEITPGADGLEIAVNYNSDLFKEETIARMAGHLSTLARTIPLDGRTPIRELELLDPAERRWLLEDFNATHTDYPAEKSIVDLFEERVDQGEDRIAVELPEGRLTYGELYARARNLARALTERHRIQPQEIVAVMADRNEWSLIGLLGVLMAGGAYLPIDPAAPKTRIGHMLADSACRVLLAEEKYIRSGGPVGVLDIAVEIKAAANGAGAQESPLSRRPAPRDLAYVIYTSGSTGTPKGVMIEHRSFVNMVLDQIRTFEVRAEDRVLQFAAASFDASMSEIFMALLAGAAVVMVSKETIYDPAAFTEYLEEKGVTHATLPPVYLSALDHSRLGSLTTLITAGEAPNIEDAVRLSREKRYFNAYGPTESSVCAAIERVVPEGDYRRGVPIGAPIANTAIYILDANLKPVPTGVAGEICISGVGLARGYLNQPELTARKFVDHPFQPGGRLYLTGDLGGFGADGKLVWLGRRDDQVKISGYRIELGEITAALLRHAAVKDAVVTAAGHRSDGLVAYYTAENALDPDELRSHLEWFLPHYMIPAHLIFLRRLPMTAHGKVDRKALPAPQAVDAGSARRSEEPCDAFEKWMLFLWREVLELPHLGIHDNFFESGGNSLRSLQLIARLSGDGAPVQVGKVPVKQLFLHPTVARLSAAIRQQQPAATVSPPARPLSHHSFSPAMTLVRENLLDRVAAGRIGPVDTAAVIVLPDGLIDGTGLGREEIIRDFCRRQPMISSITNTFMGRVAAIVLPTFASDVFSDPALLSDQVTRALSLADRIGVRTVALTGNLPPATDFGLDVAGATAGSGPVITTGQATVAAAMGMTIEKMLRISGRRLDQEIVGLVGVNTIGAATLSLMLAGMPHPRRIVLADAYNNLLLASLLRQELCDAGFAGEIEIMHVKEALPEAFYEASFIIGATHVPEIIDIKRVRPGTILVEESGQRCFSRDAAVARLEAAGDILFSEGDLLRLPFASSCELYLPEALETALRRAGALSLLAFDPNAITGCILAGLLTQYFADLTPTIGEVDGRTCLRHYRHLRRLRFSVAAPFCEGYAVGKAAVDQFSSRFAAGEYQEIQRPQPLQIN